VIFIPLEPVRQPESLVAAVAFQLRVRDQPGVAVADSVAAELRSSPRLIVLDGAEHLRGEVAGLVSRLFGAVPELRIVVTSRLLLGVPGEVCRTVPPLACPSAAAPASDVASSDAVQLFMARARERLPGFSGADVAPHAVAELCRLRRWPEAAGHYAAAMAAHRQAGHAHDEVLAMIGVGRATGRMGDRDGAIRRLRAGAGDQPRSGRERHRRGRRVLLDDRLDPDVHRDGRRDRRPGADGRDQAQGRRIVVPVQHVHGARLPGLIAFAAKLPGGILPVEPRKGTEYMVHRRGFLAGTPGIRISAGFQQSFSAGIFGGEGFILQRIGGDGRARVELAGEVVPYTLTAGQSLRVHPGHIGMFEASVSFQVMRVQGIANRYFGGDSHHFGVLSGPGTVWLQSMPLPVLAASLTPYLADAGGRGKAVEGGVIGGVISDLLR